jgi:hypothetical protein
MTRAEVAAALVNARRLVVILIEMDRVLGQLPAEALTFLSGAPGEPPHPRPTLSRRRADWHAEIDHLLATGAELSAQEIRREIERRLGRRLPYSTVMRWLRCAVESGDYEYRDRKYRAPTVDRVTPVARPKAIDLDNGGG